MRWQGDNEQWLLKDMEGDGRNYLRALSHEEELKGSAQIEVSQ